MPERRKGESAGRRTTDAELRAAAESAARGGEELFRSHEATLEGWVRALDLRDGETEGHSRRVAGLAARLAEEAGLGPDRLVHVRRGALLHDLGKMALPDSILLKPGALDADERALVRRHPEHAWEMLHGIDFLAPALDIPLYHHERWDGTGYPCGLKGEEIPLEARLFAVVDVWDALRWDRTYHAGWPAGRVRAHLADRAATQFDPDVVSLFLRLLERESGPSRPESPERT